MYVKYIRTSDEPGWFVMTMVCSLAAQLVGHRASNTQVFNSVASSSS